MNDFEKQQKRNEFYTVLAKMQFPIVMFADVGLVVPGCEQILRLVCQGIINELADCGLLKEPMELLFDWIEFVRKRPDGVQIMKSYVKLFGDTIPAVVLAKIPPEVFQDETTTMNAPSGYDK